MNDRAVWVIVALATLLLCDQGDFIARPSGHSVWRRVIGLPRSPRFSRFFSYPIRFGNGLVSALQSIRRHGMHVPNFLCIFRDGSIARKHADMSDVKDGSTRPLVGLAVKRLNVCLALNIRRIIRE